MQKSTNDSADKKVKSKKTETKTASTTSKKTTTAKKTTATKKSATKKTTAVKKATSSKATTAKKTTKTSTAKKAATSKKSTAKKSTTKKTAKKAKKVEVLEYYDLPFRYNQTVVRILAQTPNTLFVYWDISDDDRRKYIEQFGENFFNNTVPVLIVHNKTMDYSFEIEINDFANSWYFNINDPKCDYEIELGRRAKQNEVNLPNNYMHVTSSNVIETPNNHILFEKNQKVLFFRNVKTNTTVSKDVSQFEFMKYAGKIYNIYDMYKKIYKNEELESLEKQSSSNF